jgi:AraC-like DNA-binding protein
MNENICRFGFSNSADLICDRFVLEVRNSQSHTQIADSFFLNILLNGSALLTLGSETYQISQGEVFIIDKNQSFSIDTAANSAYGYIRFNGRRAKELLQRLGASYNNCIFTPAIPLEEFWNTCFKAANDQNTDLISEAVLLYTVANLTPAQQKKNSLIAQMLSITSECFCDKSFSLTKLAAKINYDTKYLSTVFKKEKGIGYREYLRELRVDHASFLMEQGVVSVKNVALLSGFSDALYFSKVFKQSKGITPSEYINKFNEKKEEEKWK